MLNFFGAKRVRQQLAALRPCTLPSPLDLTQARKVLVFAPHPDDETLGCGGTLARLAQMCSVKVVLVTDGSGAGGLPAGSALVRQAEFVKALALLGVTDSIQLNQPDGAFEGGPDLALLVQSVLDDYQPDWVFMPSTLDYHRDHVRIAAFLEPLCRRLLSVKQILFYEIWAPVPATHVVDITEQAEIKRAALAAHATAMGCGDYMRAVDGLNRYRGLYLGWDRLAEAFWVESVGGQDGLFRQVQTLALKLLSMVGRP